ncbi:hypothetical protein A9259_07970 [Vibrio cyclitrophicus]|uniref:hypothetical protein n=1 Tax=Vibrio cyclitrophicus TaxID=47951 RepID=UPI0007EEC0CC|nr:hypothetical protein [Vibrio cyclitrophicus]OBS98385.1 hypothetical protein A9259_07970 [Vibrio cyclitrophicus]
MRKLRYITSPPDSLKTESIIGRRYIGTNLSSIRKNKNSIRKGNSALNELTFPGYTSQVNKNKIRDLSNGCCAYCGLRINATSTEIVEHFRPKNALHFKINNLIPHIKNNLKTVKKNYGYFKWGNDYKNLLPSCSCCNSGQGRDGVYITLKDENGVIIDKGNLNNNVLFGKDNFFPILSNHRNRVDTREDIDYISCIKNEYSLLFNPYEDDPFQIFSYRLEPFCSSVYGEQGIKIIPNPKGTKRNKLKAQVSINLLGLNRASLCHLRYDKFLTLERIEIDFENLLSQQTTMNQWLNLMSDFKRQFNPKTAQLLGFAEQQFKDVSFNILDEFISIFPNENITSTRDFATVLCSFELLCQRHNQRRIVENNANRIARRTRR